MVVVVLSWAISLFAALHLPRPEQADEASEPVRPRAVGFDALEEEAAAVSPGHHQQLPLLPAERTSPRSMAVAAAASWSSAAVRKASEAF